MATITKTKNGNGYRIRAYAGYDVKGKQIERSTTWVIPDGMSEKAAYKEALRQAVLFEEKIKACADCDGRIKLCDFAELWFANYAEAKLRPHTVVRYRELFERINAFLGHLPLERIRPMHLIEFYKILENETKPSSYVSIIDLKNTVRARGFSKVAFSKKCGLSLNTLTQVYQGKAVSLESATKISDALEVPLCTYFQPTTEPKKLSATTISHHHRLLNDMLNDAVHWQYLQQNPCERVDPPKPDNPDIGYLDDNEAKRFVCSIYAESVPGYYRRSTMLLLLTGLRRSELLGLQWEDINWEGKFLHVSRTAQVAKKKGVYTDKTKTKASNRIVFLSDEALYLLKEQQIWQDQQSRQPGYQKPDNNRIFTDADGKLIHPDRLTHWFSKFAQKNGFDKLTLHSLRHSFASLALASGAQLSSVSAQLGHASTTITGNVYIHVIRSSQLAAATQVGNIFSSLI